MQVSHGLSGIFSVIDDHPEAFFIHLFLPGDRLHDLMDVRDDVRVRALMANSESIMLFWDNQHV